MSDDGLISAYSRKSGAVGARLLTIEPTRVALLTTGRNAWNSTWVTRYGRHRAMYWSPAAAQRAAEPLRTRGTVFYVREAPALVLRAATRTVVLADFHTTNSFAGWSPFGKPAELLQDRRVLAGRRACLRPGVELAAVVDCYTSHHKCWTRPSPSSHSLIVGESPGPAVLPSQRSSWALTKSFPRPGLRRLGWQELPAGRYLRPGSNAVVDGFQRAADALPGWSAAVSTVMSAHQAVAAPSPDWAGLLRAHQQLTAVALAAEPATAM